MHPGPNVNLTAPPVSKPARRPKETAGIMSYDHAGSDLILLHLVAWAWSSGSFSVRAFEAENSLFRLT